MFNAKIKKIFKSLSLITLPIVSINLNQTCSLSQTIVNNYSITNAFSIKPAKDTDIVVGEKIRVDINGADDGDKIDFEQNPNIKFYTYDGSSYQEVTSITYDSFDLSEFYISMVSDPGSTITIKVTNATASVTVESIINYKAVSQIALDKHEISDKADTRTNTLTATINDTANPNSQILWSCSDPEAVTFIYPSESKKYSLNNEKVGLLLRKKGTFTVTASCNAIFDSCSLIVNYAEAETILIQDFTEHEYCLECGSEGKINYDLKPMVFPEGSNQSVDWEIKMSDSTVSKPDWLNIVDNKVSWTDQTQKGNYKFTVIARASSNPKNIFIESSEVSLSFIDAQVKTIDLSTEGRDTAKVGKEVKLVAKLNKGTSLSNVIHWRVSNPDIAILDKSESLPNQTVTLKIKKVFNQPIVVTAECESITKNINVYVQQNELNVWLIIVCCSIAALIAIVGIGYYIIHKNRK